MTLMSLSHCCQLPKLLYMLSLQLIYATNDDWYGDTSYTFDIDTSDDALKNELLLLFTCIDLLKEFRRFHNIDSGFNPGN